MRHRYTDEPEHPSVRAAKDLRAIARTWPHLESALARTGAPGQGGGKPTKSASQPLVINAHVSDVMGEIASWAHFLARTLLNETIDYLPPQQPGTPALLESIALRVGHFLGDHDLANTFPDDCHDNARKAHNTAHPNGARRIPTRVKCLDHGTDQLGQRVPCDGEYTVLLNPDSHGLIPDMVCNQDKAHRITPAEWQRLERRGPADPVAARAMLARIRGEVA